MNSGRSLLLRLTTLFSLVLCAHACAPNEQDIAGTMEGTPAAGIGGGEANSGQSGAGSAIGPAETNAGGVATAGADSIAGAAGANSIAGAAGQSGASGSAGSGATRPDTGPKPSTGCSANGPAAAGLLNEKILLRGAQRDYMLAVPAGLTATRAAALVFVLHGRSGTAAGVRTRFALEPIAGKAAIFVYPTALLDETGVTTWDRERVDSNDVALFDALVRVVSERYCIDMNRIFSTGESNGGHMSSVLGCLRSNVLRAIAPVIGRGPVEAVRAACTSQTVGVWLANGSKDTTVPIDEAESTHEFWRVANGCQASTAPTAPSPCVKHAGCMADAPVVWCIFDGGHSTPVFAPPAIWQFFDTFR